MADENKALEAAQKTIEEQAKQLAALKALNETGLQPGEKHVYSKNRIYTAIGAGNLAFADGHAITDNKHLLKWYEAHGYLVTEKKLTEDEIAQNFAPKKK